VPNISIQAAFNPQFGSIGRGPYCATAG